MINNERPMTLQEAQSFAQAMGQLTSEQSKDGYIVKEGHTYRHVSREEASNSGKMNVRDVVSTAQRVTEFAKAHIAEGGGLTGEELKNIEVGMSTLKTRITQHKKTFTQMFVNFTKIANTLLQGESFKTQLEDAIKERPAPKLNDNDNHSIIDSFLKGGTDKTLEECKRDKLNDKFKKDNADLIQKYKDFLGKDCDAHTVDVNVNSLVSSHEGIKSAKKVDQPLLDSTKQQLSADLSTVCTQNKKLSDLERNEVFNRSIQKYRQMFPRELEKSSIQIVKELTKIDLIDKPMNRFSPLVSQSTSTHVALLAQMMDKIDPSRKPEAFSEYTMTTGAGYFIDQQKDTGNLDRKEGETTLSHMFHLIDHLDTHPSDDQNVKDLHKDLKRSLPLAFEAGVIAAKRENRIAGRNLEREAEQLSGKIYEALSKMAPGERLFLPMGCEGHGTLLIMTKTDEGVEVQHINTGYQLEAHSDLLGVGGNLQVGIKAFQGKYPIGVKADIQIGPQRQEDIKSSIAGLIRVANGENTNMKDATEHFRQLAGKGRGFKPSILRRDQQAQNCSYRCFLEGIRAAVGVDSYRGLKVGLIDRIEEDYSNIPGTTKGDEFVTKLETIKRKTVEVRDKPKTVEARSKSKKTSPESPQRENISPQKEASSVSGSASSSKSSKSKKASASAASSSTTKSSGGLFRRMRGKNTKSLSS